MNQEFVVNEIRDFAEKISNDCVLPFNRIVVNQNKLATSINNMESAIRHGPYFGAFAFILKLNDDGIYQFHLNEVVISPNPSSDTISILERITGYSYVPLKINNSMTQYRINATGIRVFEPITRNMTFSGDIPTPTDYFKRIEDDSVPFVKFIDKIVKSVLK